MKNIYQYLLLTLLFSYAVFAQQLFLQTVTLSPTAYKIFHMNDYDHNYNPYMNAGTINNQNKNFSIGHQYYSSGPREDDYYRSMYKFDLTPIPANAIITNVMLV